MRHKKAMSLSLNAIMIIALPVILVIVLIFVFSGQAERFYDIIRNYGGESNIDSVVSACNLLVQRDAAYEYCCVKKKITAARAAEEDAANKATKIIREMTCRDLKSTNYSAGRIEFLDCESVFCEEV